MNLSRRQFLLSIGFVPVSGFWDRDSINKNLTLKDFSPIYRAWNPLEYYSVPFYIIDDLKCYDVTIRILGLSDFLNLRFRCPEACLSITTEYEMIYKKIKSGPLNITTIRTDIRRYKFKFRGIDGPNFSLSSLYDLWESTIPIINLTASILDDYGFRNRLNATIFRSRLKHIERGWWRGDAKQIIWRQTEFGKSSNGS